MLKEDPHTRETALGFLERERERENGGEGKRIVPQDSLTPHYSSVRGASMIRAPSVIQVSSVTFPPLTQPSLTVTMVQEGKWMAEVYTAISCNA